jgi:hypothetical protein
VSSPGYAPASEQDPWLAQRPALQSWTLRQVGATHTPQRASSVLRFFESLGLRRKYPAEVRALVARARRFTPGVADRVATLARINPDAALETFVSAFQQRHFELDESVVDQGFEFWAEGNADFIPVLMRGTDRCNGIERLGYRPGYTLQWALIQDVFYADERPEVIAEVADALGSDIADRLASVRPAGASRPLSSTEAISIPRHCGVQSVGAWGRAVQPRFGADPASAITRTINCSGLCRQRRPRTRGTARRRLSLRQ